MPDLWRFCIERLTFQRDLNILHALQIPHTLTKIKPVTIISGVKQYFEQTRSLAFSLLAIFPLVLLYEILIVQLNQQVHLEIRNAAEKFLKDFLGLAGITLTWQLGLLYLAITLIVMIYARNRNQVIVPPLRFWGLLILESLAYAAFFGYGTRFLTKLILSLQAQGVPVYESLSKLHKFMLAIAAGVYEEILFRLILLGSILYIFKKIWQARLWVQAMLASAIAAAVFAIFHYPTLEHVTWDSFMFRLIAGWILGIIYVARGLAVVVYTHALYDILYIMNFL